MHGLMHAQWLLLFFMNITAAVGFSEIFVGFIYINLFIRWLKLDTLTWKFTSTVV